VNTRPHTQDVSSTGQGRHTHIAGASYTRRCIVARLFVRARSLTTTLSCCFATHARMRLFSRVSSPAWSRARSPSLPRSGPPVAPRPPPLQRRGDAHLAVPGLRVLGQQLRIKVRRIVLVQHLHRSRPQLACLTAPPSIHPCAAPLHAAAPPPRLPSAPTFPRACADRRHVARTEGPQRARCQRARIAAPPAAACLAAARALAIPCALPSWRPCSCLTRCLACARRAREATNFHSTVRGSPCPSLWTQGLMGPRRRAATRRRERQTPLRRCKRVRICPPPAPAPRCARRLRALCSDGAPVVPAWHHRLCAQAPRRPAQPRR